MSTLDSPRQEQLNTENADDNALFNSHIGLVYALAKRFSGRGAEYDELVQSGFLGLVLAQKRFDPSRGTAFSSYAFKYVEGEMRAQVRKSTSPFLRRSALENDEKFDVFDRKSHQNDAFYGNKEELINEEAVRAFEDAEKNRIDSIFVKELLEKLDRLEAAVIALRYLEEKTQSETGKILGISQSSVSRLEKAALLALNTTVGR